MIWQYKTILFHPAVRFGLFMLIGAVVLAVLVSPHGFEIGNISSDVFFTLRLPRIVVAAIVGAALSAAGVAFQALLANPLADPYIMGVSGGAALFGTIALLLVSHTFFLIPLFAFLGAFSAAFGTFLLANKLGGSTLHLLLTGVIFNAFAAGVITLLKTLVTASKAQEILFWLMGTLGYPTYSELLIMGIGIGIGLLGILRFAPQLNLLSFGDMQAKAMGAEVAKTKLWVFLFASLVVGVAVAQVGMIGFIGLVVPHMIRIRYGPDHRILVPSSILLGSGLLILADTLARLSFIVFHSLVPVGAVTAFLGGPFFIYLLYKTRNILVRVG